MRIKTKSSRRGPVDDGTKVSKTASANQRCRFTVAELQCYAEAAPPGAADAEVLKNCKEKKERKEKEERKGKKGGGKKERRGQDVRKRRPLSL